MVDVNLDPNKTSVMIGKANKILDFLESELKIIYPFTNKEVENVVNIKPMNPKETSEKSNKVPRLLPHEEMMLKEMSVDQTSGTKIFGKECMNRMVPSGDSGLESSDLFLQKTTQ